MADDDRTGMVQKALTDEELEARGKDLAKAELELEKLREKKRSHNREWNEQLRQMAQNIAVLAEEVHTGKAWVSAQTGMFDGDEEDETPPPPKARRGRRRNSEAPAAAASA